MLTGSIHSNAQSEKVDSLLGLLRDSLYSNTAELYNNIAEAYDYSDLEKSLEYAEKAKQAALSDKDQLQLATAYRNIGNYYNEKFQIDEAKSYYNTALNIYESINHAKGQAQLINLLGILHGKTQQYDSAYVNFTKALNIAKEIRDSITLTMIYTNFGLVFYHWGDYEQAVKYYELSQEINIALNLLDGLERNYANLGKIAYKWGKPELALDYYNKTHAILKRLGNRKSIGNIYLDIGNAYKRLKQVDSALISYHKAYDIAKEFNSVRIMSIALGNIGNFYRDSFDYEAAYKYYHESYNLIKGVNDKKRMAQKLQSLGDLYRIMGQYDSASVYLKKALKMSEEMKNRFNKRRCYLYLFELYRDMKDYESALVYFINYSKINDTIFDENSRREFADFEARYNSEKQLTKIGILEKEKEINRLEIKKQKQQKYFLIIVIGLVLFVGILILNWYIMRQKSIRNKMEIKNQNIEHRLLRAQMNPHFIFNSLNAIQSFINENNPDSASWFLSKFASLIRHNLVSTRSAFVPLEQEVNALRNNLELEKIRFNDCFNFEITLDNNIDQAVTQIPPLLIQPFVENSILHGFSEVKSGGQIEISFNRKEKTIEVMIVDNGIGREKSGKARDKSLKKKSIGTQLIKERLELLNHQGKKNNLFTIIDLYDGNGKANGTKIVLSIPFETTY